MSYEHDEQCEAEFIEGAYGYTDCGCEGRRFPDDDARKAMRRRQMKQDGFWEGLT